MPAAPQPQPSPKSKRSKPRPEGKPLRPRPEELTTAAPTPSRSAKSPLLGGFLLAVLFPFLSVSLINPQRTGYLGETLQAYLYWLFGLASMLLPLLSMALGLRLLLPRPRRTLQLTWAPTLLWLDMLWLAQRMGGQGGVLGANIDGLFLATVGPMGSWLLAWLCLPLTTLMVCRVSPAQAAHSLADALHWAQDRSHQAWETAGQVEIPLPQKLLPVPTFHAMEEPEPRPAPLPAFEVENLARLAAPVPQPESVHLPALPVAAVQQPTVRPGVQSFEAVIVESMDLQPLPPVVAETVSFAPPPLPIPVPIVAAPSVPSVESEPTADEAEAPSLEVEITLEEQLPSVEEELPFVEKLPSVEALPSEEVVAEEEAEPEEELPEEEEVQVIAAPVKAEKIWDDGVLEEPDGQLRLFPGPAAAPAATYKLPLLSLLNEAPPNLARRPIEDKSQILLDALASFGVQATLLALVRGPAVTRYELQPARGVKVSRFTSLTNDIALALAAIAVRIEAPIPGKSAIGIEIPNENTDLVVLKDILASPKFRKSVGLSIALGKDLGGNPTFTNLQKMPHLLVAGTTGSGKSVCVNGLILSLLYRFTPRQLQILMIDPKQVELSIYEGIPHLISFAGQSSPTPGEGAIIVDPKRAAIALHQIVELMEHRYGQFAAARVRNLEEYNQASGDPLPWVVVIIDELADLMMVASKTVETSICRIAQKARAAGIHLVLATQRPSADVITGLIKVNIPSRVAFAVSSQVDSRVILDTGGAEQLLGKGDMLFCPVDASDPRRLQGCYVTNEEILRVVEWWKAQACPDNLIELQAADVPEEGGDDEEGSEDDLLVEQALQVVVRRRQASASLLQTELKVGYARARRLVYLMEKKGYIGPAEGSKPRKILYQGG